jgi:mono/diheme cytochrome c family protein
MTQRVSAPVCRAPTTLFTPRERPVSRRGWLRTLGIIGVAASALFGVSAQAQTSPYSAESDYRDYCSSCHGSRAKGDGAIAKSLLRRPSDLTTLRRRNNGRFPAEKVFKAVDGRRTFVHSDSDMPAWAEVFSTAAESRGAENAVARIDALVSYLQTLQVK